MIGPTTTTTTTTTTHAIQTDLPGNGRAIRPITEPVMTASTKGLWLVPFTTTTTVLIIKLTDLEEATVSTGDARVII